jgi:4'-phosphopantetheinyl transferase
MECVSFEHCRDGDYSVIAGSVERLAETPLDAGQVVCLGLRLAGFSAAAWRGLHGFLGSATNGVGVRISQAETDRAHRYLRCEDGVRHLLGRGLLRQAMERLGGHLLPAVWPLNAWGKPEAVLADVHFNISHSGNDVWIALSRSGAVGLDVEDTSPAVEDLSSWLHPAETESLRDCGDLHGRRRLWARKEAVIKAVGMGLSLPLSDFRVAVDARSADWLLQAPSAFPAPWSTYDIPAPGEVAAAVAVRGKDVALSWRLACLQWDGAGELT